jgi:circadian clock protein KaiB
MDASRPESPDITVLRLYVAGDTLKSRLTIENLKDICRKHLHGQCNLEVIDLKKHPDQAIKKNISALPTLIKELPLPVRTMIGDLASKEKVLVALDIKRVGEEKTPRGKAKSAEELRVEYEELLKEYARLKADNDNLRLLLRKNDR